MKKNEIRFIATENGINCEGNVVLSISDRIKCEEMLQQVQDAAKDYGASLSITPTGIQLGFNVACSCEMDTIHEAAARMKYIIEKMRDFIGKLEEKHEETPEDKVIAEQQHEAVNKFFDEMHEKYPNAKLAIVCDDNDWVSVALNTHPMNVLHDILGAINDNKHGENQ